MNFHISQMRTLPHSLIFFNQRFLESKHFLYFSELPKIHDTKFKSSSFETQYFLTGLQYQVIYLLLEEQADTYFNITIYMQPVSINKKVFHPQYTILVKSAYVTLCH